MRRQALKSVVSAAALLIWILGIAHGQQRTATLTGSVADPSQALISGAKVTATHIETSQRFTTTSSSSGDYALAALPVGEYEVTAEASGFNTLSKRGVVLAVGQTVRVDFNLAVGSTAQVAEVTGQVPLIDATNASIEQVISPHMVEALPLNQRDIVALTTLAPGVLPPRGQVAGGNLANGGFVVRGRRRSDNIIFLNGALVTQGNGAPTFLPNIDAIQEFQIKSGLYGAQYGIMDGGQLVVVTKSGGNRIHGDAFEYFRNNAIAAANFFQPTKPSFNRNDYGGTFGGPVYIPKLFDGRNKAWFFLSLERVSTQQYTPLAGTVPTTDQKQGQFSTTIIDPATGQPFPNNLIPASRISPVAAQFLQFWPAPNTAGSVNFFSPNSTANPTTAQIMTKADYQQKPSIRWWGQYVHDITPNIASSAIQRFSLNQPISTTVASVGRVDTFGGKYVNDISLHYFRRPYQETLASGANCTFSAGLGIPQLLTTGVDTCGVPDVAITGFLGVGDTSLVGPVLTGTWWLPEEFSFQKGRHFLEAGVDWRRQFNLYALGQRSSLSFTNLYSKNALANFLLGLPTSSTLGGESLRLNQAMNTLFYWVQDSWRANSKLTIDLGLRYESRMPLKDKRGWSANFNPSNDTLYPALVNQVLQPGQQGRFIGGVPLVKFSALQGFLPRIAFAYQLPANTVIRAGYSLYASEPVVGEMQNLGSNPRPGAAQLIYTNNVTSPVFDLSNPFPSNLAGQAVPSAAGLQNPFKLERSHEWGLSLQTAFSQNWAFDLGYDGSHTQNVIEQLSLNDAPPGPGAVQARRPYQNFASIQYALADADGSFNGLDVRLQKRASNDGLTLLFGFSWSKAIDNTDSRLAITGENSGRSINMPLSRNRGLSSSNIGLRFISSLDYQLPFGPGRSFATEGWTSKVAGGWSVQTITTVQSGPFFTVFLPGDPLNTGNTASEWPNRTCNPNLSHSQRTRQAWFNTGCFATPAAYTYGNAGRSSVQGPGIVNADIALHRTFNFAESQSIEFRAEAFNTFNHPNFGLPGASYGVAGFGTITSALDPRQIQLGFKYIF